MSWNHLWYGLLSVSLFACGGSTELHPAADGGDIVEPSTDVSNDVSGLPDVVVGDTLEPETETAGEDVAGVEVTEDVLMPSDADVVPSDADVVPSDADVVPSDASDDASGADVAPPSDAGPEELQPVPAGAAPGRAPIRRLTSMELDNTVRDLVGVEEVVALTLPPDPETQGFDNQIDAQSVTPSFVEALMLMSEQVAAQVEISAVVPCVDEVGESACGHGFIEQFGRRALRRPLTEDQQGRFEGLFDGALEDWGFDEAIRMVIMAMLQSPHFIYRVEFGLAETQTGANVRLSPHEMAVRLSYLLWETMPDEVLDEAADAGELVSLESVVEQTERMIDEPGTKRMLDHFHREWLLLDRLIFMAAISDKFASFRTETRLFVQQTLYEGEGTLHALLTSPDTFVDGTGAAVYDSPELGGWVASWIPNTEAFRATSLDPTRRSGVLTQPSVLSVHSVAPSGLKSLIRRGVFFLDRLLCAPLPPPPTAVEVAVPLDDETDLATPALLAAHTGNPACAGCHTLIDPIGLSFEHYDAIGVWRDAYHDGTVVDTATELVGTSIDGPYDHAVDLAHGLAASDIALSCYVRHWYRFAHGRAVETDDHLSYEAVLDASAAAGGDIMALVRALVTTDAFLYRPWTPPSQEDTP